MFYEWYFNSDKWGLMHVRWVLQINSMNLGKSMKDREKSIGDIVSELNIIREHLKHPNIVRYYKTFVEGL